MKPAFSTVACPDWTLERVASFAAEAGYLGVELRSFGSGSSTFTPEPALTDPAKVRELFEDAGVAVSSLATGISFCRAVWPPIIGHVFSDPEAPVREAREAVLLARAIRAPSVRVFGFEFRKGESRASGVRRVVQRLQLAATTARNTGVQLVVENGGSFPTAVDLMELLDAADNPLVRASYSVAVAHAAGEDPAAGVHVLGSSLATVKVKDFTPGADGGREQTTLGGGDLPLEDTVAALAREGFDGWIVREWDRLWLRHLADPASALKRDAETLYRWMAAHGRAA